MRDRRDLGIERKAEGGGKAEGVELPHRLVPCHVIEGADAEHGVFEEVHEPDGIGHPPDASVAAVPVQHLFLRVEPRGPDEAHERIGGGGHPDTEIGAEKKEGEDEPGQGEKGEGGGDRQRVGQRGEREERHERDERAEAEGEAHGRDAAARRGGNGHPIGQGAGVSGAEPFAQGGEQRGAAQGVEGHSAPPPQRTTCSKPSG